MGLPAGGPGALLRVPAAAPRRRARGPRLLRRALHGDPLHRTRRPGLQPGLRRGHLRQRRRPLPAGERLLPGPGVLDRPHRLRHPRPAPDHPDQEGAGPALLGGGHRASAPRRPVLEGRGRALQRRQGLQVRGSRRARRHRHRHRGQLLRLLQEGGQDPDRVLGQPLRLRGGGARRRRRRLPALQPGPGVHRHPHPRGPDPRARHRAQPRPLRGAPGRVRRRRGRPHRGAGARRRPLLDAQPDDHLDRPRRPGGLDPAARGQHLRGPQRLPGPRQAPRGRRHPVAPGGHRPLVHAGPQAGHRLRRRQVGDLQVPPGRLRLR